MIGLSKVPSFEMPRRPLLSKSISQRKLEWAVNRAALTLNPWPSTLKRLSIDHQANNSTYRKDNWEDFPVKVWMKWLRALTVGWEIVHMINRLEGKFLLSVQWEMRLYIHLTIDAQKILYHTLCLFPLFHIPKDPGPSHYKLHTKNYTRFTILGFLMSTRGVWKLTASNNMDRWSLWMHTLFFFYWQKQQSLSPYPWNGLMLLWLNSLHSWLLLMRDRCQQKMST